MKSDNKYRQLYGKMVKVIFNDGDVCHGILESYDPGFESDDGKPELQFTSFYNETINKRFSYVVAKESEIKSIIY